LIHHQRSAGKDDRKIEVDNRAAAESNRATGDANAESERAGAIKCRAGDRCKSLVYWSHFTARNARRRSLFPKNSETFSIGSGENK
jgi:hypothetical protein